MKNDFREALARDAALVNGALERWLPESGGAYARVREAMRYSVGAGGKRIRPVLTLAFARLCGGAAEQALPFACAVECVHTYSLIHDDLPCMDDDALRRGKASCHIAFGEAEALLAGDALLTLAFELIGGAPALAGTPAAACGPAALELARFSGVDGMVGGQVMDLQNEGKPAGLETIWGTYRKKTSALLAAAGALGVLAAGGSTELREIAVRFGGALGLAFQTVDDILDVTGDEAALGKPTGSDREQEKATVVTALGLEGARDMAARLTGEAIECLEGLPGNGFLLELTRFLLSREH